MATRTPVFRCRCGHSPVATIRWRRTERGVIYQAQCDACGGAIGDSVQQAPVRRMLGGAEPPEWDQSIAFGASGQLAGRYADYLRSDEWRAKRLRVFERCDGLCEGCRGAPAVQVHHLTYEHIGNEFLWELVGVCRDCHERAHGRDPEPDEEWFPW